MVAMVLTPPSGWDPRHFGKWSLKLPHESSSQPAKSRFKKNECQMLLWNSCVVNTFAPEHIEIYLLEVVRLLGKHIHKTWRGLTSLANDGPMTPEGNTWKNSSIKKQLPIWEKYYYPQLQHHWPGPPSFQPFGKVDQKSRLGIPKNHGWGITWGCFSQGTFNLPYIFQLILYCTTVTSEKIVSPGDHPSIRKDRSKSRTGAIKPGAIRCVSQHSPESNRFFHFGNGFKWPNVIPKPIITWISHPILIQKVAPKKIHPKMASFCTRQDLPKKRVDLLQLILHSTVVATIMVAAPSGHCALTGGGSSPAREGMNPPIFSSHLYRPLGCFRK